MYDLQKAATSDKKQSAQRDSIDRNHFHIAVTLASLCSRSYSFLYYQWRCEIMIRPHWRISKMFHTAVTSNGMCNALCNAQWLEYELLSKKKFSDIIFPQTLTFFIYSTSSQRNTLMLLVDTIKLFSAVCVPQKRIFLV